MLLYRTLNHTYLHEIWTNDRACVQTAYFNLWMCSFSKVQTIREHKKKTPLSSKIRSHGRMSFRFIVYHLIKVAPLNLRTTATSAHLTPTH